MSTRAGRGAVRGRGRQVRVPKNESQTGKHTPSRTQLPKYHPVTTQTLTKP